jgi:glycosyltransferase involved in cell wall biosynthesis
LKAVQGASLPDLCDDGHVLIVCKYYHHPVVAMAIIMRNLLSRFNQESFTVITEPVPGMQKRYPGAHDYCFAALPFFLPERLHPLWNRVQIPVASAKAASLIRELNVRVTVVCHVGLHEVTVARNAAKTTQTPWIPYIHNMIWENYRNMYLEKEAAKVQKQVFEEASSLMVMCDGIKDLYQERYGVKSRSIVHNHVEPVRESLPNGPVKPQCFLSGHIYWINEHAVKRILEAATRLGLPLVVTAPETHLAKAGITDQVRREFYPEREGYLAALEEQAILVAALDWPDESRQTEEELLTLLPTRVVEYLAVGRPVLAHCPPESFMAKFLLRHKCAMVVTDPSVEAVADAMKHLIEGGAAVAAMCQAGLDTVRNVFGIDKVAGEFQDEINSVAKLNWGQKLR